SALARCSGPIPGIPNPSPPPAISAPDASPRRRPAELDQEGSMISKSFMVIALTLALASGALAAGSSSSSRPPAPSQAQPSDYDLGVKAVQAGDYGRALTRLERVVKADPRNADAWNYLGFSHRKLKHFDQSLAAYQKALAINPDHRGANEYL